MDLTARLAQIRERIRPSIERKVFLFSYALTNNNSNLNLNSNLNSTQIKSIKLQNKSH
jgi:hypothetical protein